MWDTDFVGKTVKVSYYGETFTSIIKKVEPSFVPGTNNGIHVYLEGKAALFDLVWDKVQLVWANKHKTITAHIG